MARREEGGGASAAGGRSPLGDGEAVSFGDLLRTYRGAASLTQEELAGRAGGYRYTYSEDIGPISRGA